MSTGCRVGRSSENQAGPRYSGIRYICTTKVYFSTLSRIASPPTPFDERASALTYHLSSINFWSVYHHTAAMARSISSRHFLLNAYRDTHLLSLPISRCAVQHTGPRRFKWDLQHWQITNLEGSSGRLRIGDHSRIDLIHRRQISDVFGQLHPNHQECTLEKNCDFEHLGPTCSSLG